MVKSLNYGLLKEELPVDKSRISWDYFKGILDTDGSIKKIGYSFIITQSHPKFLKALGEFVKNEKGLTPKFYMNGLQLSFHGKDILDFLINYKIKDFNSYYSGIIDGDGSFSSHKSQNGVYWRFQIGAKKERKIKIFNELFKFYKFKPSIHITKQKMVTYSLNSKEDVRKLTLIIKHYSIIKNHIASLVLGQIEDYNKKLKFNCQYCNCESDRILAKGTNAKKTGDSIECRKKDARIRVKRWKDKHRIYAHADPKQALEDIGKVEW